MKRRTRLLLLCLAVLAAGTGFLTLRGILAQRVELAAYNGRADAERFLALPLYGGNFRCNSLIGYGVGRYYLQGRAAATVLGAYAALERTRPGLRFTYAEMGWNGGGRFRPHRTHQKGMSADFITPVYTADAAGNRVPGMLSCNILNLWGYAVRLDDAGRFEEYRFDTSAMIAHLAALERSGTEYGVRIERVILEPPLLRLLRADPDFKSISGIRFMENRAWFPHDGHYHIDFARLRGA